MAQSTERTLEGVHREEGPLTVAIMAVGQVQEQSRVSHMGELTQYHHGLADSMRENPLFSSGMHTCVICILEACTGSVGSFIAPVAGAPPVEALMPTALLIPVLPLKDKKLCRTHGFV